MKKINCNMSVFDMIEQYPESKNLLVLLGLNGVENPLMLRTAGKKMTLRKGAKLKKIPWETVVKLFETNGFILEEEE